MKTCINDPNWLEMIENWDTNSKLLDTTQNVAPSILNYSGLRWRKRLD